MVTSVRLPCCLVEIVGWKKGRRQKWMCVRTIQYRPNDFSIASEVRLAYVRETVQKLNALDAVFDLLVYVK